LIPIGLSKSRFASRESEEGDCGIPQANRRGAPWRYRGRVNRRTEQRLRDAERSGDGVALLRAKLHAGELTEAHIELAARLGHATARELCPDVELVDWENEGQRQLVVGG
jgi:hypothetical protein